jgi:uncharacterized membrane protein
VRNPIVAALFAIAACGCSGGPPGPPPSCAAVPTSCPSPQPHFAADVFPIFQTSCQTCHLPDGSGSVRLFLDYATIREAVTTITMQVAQCRMPPADGPQITDEQRAAIVGWVRCGALDD